MDLDPFLLQDAFRSDDPDDHIAGTRRIRTEGLKRLLTY